MTNKASKWYHNDNVFGTPETLQGELKFKGWNRSYTTTLTAQGGWRQINGIRYFVPNLIKDAKEMKSAYQSVLLPIV